MTGTAAPKPEDDRQYLTDLAFECLRNYLELACKVLKMMATSREAQTRRSEIIAVACDAYEHSVEVLSKLPSPSPQRKKEITEAMRDFRTCLAEIRIEMPSARRSKKPT